MTVPGRRDLTLLFVGHLDTVPFDADEWAHDPLGERVSDRIYGRGATDVKGTVAAMVSTASAFAETGTEPPVDLAFAFVSDEEIGGSAGFPALLDAGLLDADACVVGEPTCEEGRHSVTVADRGSIWLTMEAACTAAHGSRPSLGENAVDRLLSPSKPESGLVTIDVPDPAATIERLADEGVVVRDIPLPDAIRASVHAVNTETDVQQLLDGLDGEW